MILNKDYNYLIERLIENKTGSSLREFIYPYIIRKSQYKNIKKNKYFDLDSDFIYNQLQKSINEKMVFNIKENQSKSAIQKIDYTIDCLIENSSEEDIKKYIIKSTREFMCVYFLKRVYTKHNIDLSEKNIKINLLITLLEDNFYIRFLRKEQMIEWFDFFVNKSNVIQNNEKDFSSRLGKAANTYIIKGKRSIEKDEIKSLYKMIKKKTFIYNCRDEHEIKS
jgi:hypothetical protein